MVWPMKHIRDVQVHLVPSLVPPGRLGGTVAIAIDVLRATTTMVQALAAGCLAIRPCAEVDEALALASSFPAGKSLLGGERGGLPLPGFDLGNSPREYTAKRCKGLTLIMTTTNGTRALLKAGEADRAFAAAFVNFSAVCEQVCQDPRPLHILCAGTGGEPTLEDTLLAGAFVDVLSETQDVHLNDSARLAWDAFENHGRILFGALEISQGGEDLIRIGMKDDLTVCAEVDRFHIAPEIRRDPFRLEVGSVGIVKSRWRK